MFDLLGKKEKESIVINNNYIINLPWRITYYNKQNVQMNWHFVLPFLICFH